jgi:hypothetical protein
VVFHSHKVPREFKFTETERRTEVPGPGGAENKELLLNGYRISVFQDEKRSGDG